jgi:hypothetical protein
MSFGRSNITKEIMQNMIEDYQMHMKREEFFSKYSITQHTYVKLLEAFRQNNVTRYPKGTLGLSALVREVLEEKEN